MDAAAKHHQKLKLHSKVCDNVSKADVCVMLLLSLQTDWFIQKRWSGQSWYHQLKSKGLVVLKEDALIQKSGIKSETAAF